MIVAIDFDGTVVEHRYPDIGKPVPGALEWMKEFMVRGISIMLWTMRSGEELRQAVDYCESNGIKLWGVNISIGQEEWTSSPKQYANLYIDDAAVGCPLVESKRANATRLMVDWPRVGPMTLERLGLTRLQAKLRG